MDILSTTKNVIIDAIKVRAAKNNYKKSEVQLVLYVDAKNNNKIGIVFCKNGVAEVKSSINSILGMYSLIPNATSNVNDKIYNALDKFSKEKQINILFLQARLYVIENELLVDLYIKNEFEEKITIEQILN